MTTIGWDRTMDDQPIRPLGLSRPQTWLTRRPTVHSEPEVGTGSHSRNHPLSVLPGATILRFRFRVVFPGERVLLSR